MKHRLITLITTLFITTNISAQQTKSLTLKEAVDLTLAYNKTLKINKEKITQAALKHP